MQAQGVRVTIRVNRQLKKNAEDLFDCLGLNMSNAVNIFLRKAVDQRGIPFPVNTGPVDTGGQGVVGLSTGEVTKAFNDAVKQCITKKQKEGLPVARYDMESGRAYLENADGSREYV
jgi:antitoxin component of RelBE/YafQ-DinJ toxin-antitoxin module